VVWGPEVVLLPPIRTAMSEIQFKESGDISMMALGILERAL